MVPSSYLSWHLSLKLGHWQCQLVKHSLSKSFLLLVMIGCSLNDIVLWLHLNCDKQIWLPKCKRGKRKRDIDRLSKSAQVISYQTGNHKWTVCWAFHSQMEDKKWSTLLSFVYLLWASQKRKAKVGNHKSEHLLRGK